MKEHQGVVWEASKGTASKYSRRVTVLLHHVFSNWEARWASCSELFLRFHYAVVIGWNAGHGAELNLHPSPSLEVRRLGWPHTLKALTPQAPGWSIFLAWPALTPKGPPWIAETLLLFGKFQGFGLPPRNQEKGQILYHTSETELDKKYFLIVSYCW